jgi:hypothetical protein
MGNAMTLTGTLTDERTIRLDENLSLPKGKVRITLEPLTQETAGAKLTPEERMAVLESIWADQIARGHQPPTKEEVDAYIQGERDSWDD